MICFASVPAMAADNSAGMKLCTDADLAGNFALADLRETPKGEEAAWYQDFRSQYIMFYPGHTYNFVASRHKLSTEDDLKKALALSIGDGMHTPERKYTLDGNGVLNLYIEDRLDYSYRCMFVTKGYSTLKTGDIVFTGYSKRRTSLYKVFRRWP
jgi:hypothetical protein